MKNIIQIIFSFTFFILMSFTKAELFPPEEKIPEPDSIIHKIMDETIDELKSRFHLTPCGTGMNGKFEYLEISFELSEKQDQDALRDILLTSSQLFLKKINDSQEARKYLKPSPFGKENIGIILFISDKNHEDVWDPDICCASYRKGSFFYKTTSKEDEYQYKSIIKETYEQAFSKIAKSRSLAPREEKPSPK